MLVKPRVHFLENDRRMRPVGPNSSEWQSGNWYRIGKQKADALIGGGIYFHTAQSEPSYGGGIITGYRIIDQGEFKGRYVFTYRPSPDFVGFFAGRDGWTWRDKKFVL